MTQEYNCAEGGAYVGTQKRTCYLGKEDGEWGNVSGTCVSVVLLIILVLILILIIAIVIFIVIRVSSRAKAVGGVRGRSAKSAGSKKMSKRESSKKTVKI